MKPLHERLLGHLVRRAPRDPEEVDMQPVTGRDPHGLNLVTALPYASFASRTRSFA